MIFSSVTFLFFFLPAFLLIYFATPAKNATLLVFSIIFYGWGEPRFIPILLVYTVINYLVGRLIVGRGKPSLAWLIVGLSADMGFLLYYKYFNFLTSQINSCLEQIGAHPLASNPVALPLGISFIAFQGISYVIDIYRGVVAPQRSLVSFAMYKSMFPQLIAGPIVRYSDIAADIDLRAVRTDEIAAGMRQFVVGLGQKVLIANVLAPVADQVFAAAQIDMLTAWLGLTCYTLQIFFDFAGYSNMAIGLGRVIGFRYPVNFDRPYASQSITEFWRRWHMTLSRWFRDYLYIPLGGNRVSRPRVYMNMFIVFLLCGFWHGASWNFVAWGAYHGAFLSIERAGLSKLVAAAPRLLRHVYTMLVVACGWVFFRADSLPAAAAFFNALAGQTLGSPVTPWERYLTGDVGLAIAVGAVLAAAPPLKTAFSLSRDLGAVRALGVFCAQVVVLSIFLLCLVEISAGAYNPFIYYRF